MLCGMIAVYLGYVQVIKPRRTSEVSDQDIKLDKMIGGALNEFPMESDSETIVNSTNEHVRI